MTMQGMAFLPIWHDIEQGFELDFDRWHTIEHMPERVATPGITVGRRYAKPAGERLRYFTLYEAASFGVFASEGYYATANARSEWTQRLHPRFQNFLRSPCHLVMTRGHGVGGALASIRVTFDAVRSPDDRLTTKDSFTLAVRPLVEGLMQIDLVTGAHAGVSAAVNRRPLSEDSLSLRPHATAFNGVLMVETIGRDALDRALPGIHALLDTELRSVGSYEIDAYDLAYLLSR